MVEYASEAPRKKLPLETTIHDDNMLLIDEHKNARGNEVLKFRNRITGETITYPNVNLSHLSDDLKQRLVIEPQSQIASSSGTSVGGTSISKPTSSSQVQVPPPPLLPDPSYSALHIPNVQLPVLDSIEKTFNISDTHLNEPRDGIQLLLNDHETVRQLFGRFNGYKNDTLKMKQLIRSIIREVCVHASIEEQFVYPLMRQLLPNGEDIANRFLTDDRCNKLLLSQLETMDPAVGDPLLYLETVQKFFMNETQHMQDEELYLSELHQMMNNDMLANLYDGLMKAKSGAPTHPHPEVADRPEFGASLFQSMTGQSDRMVDDIIDFNMIE